VKNSNRDDDPVYAKGRERLEISRAMTRDESVVPPQRHWSSRILHRIGRVSEHAAAGSIAAAAIVAWVLFGITSGFPSWWDNVLFVVSSSVTVVMVFALQHTQARQQAVTQRKLDELLRAQPTADDRLIALEGASDDELVALTDLSQAHRERALGTDTIHPIADSPT
jgi:low affinity Fe/Cu permease